MSQIIIDTNDIQKKTTLKEIMLLSYIKMRLTNVPLCHIDFKDIMSHVNIGFTVTTIKSTAKRISQYNIDIKKDELVIHNEIKTVNVVIQKNNKSNKENKTNNKKYSKEIINITNHVIGFLNEITTLNYRKSLYYNLIQNAVDKGYTQESLIEIVANKYTEWHGTDMSKYITPDTLFKENHLDKYLNMAIDYSDKVKNAIKKYDVNGSIKNDDNLNKNTIYDF